MGSQDGVVGFACEDITAGCRVYNVGARGFHTFTLTLFTFSWTLLFTAYIYYPTLYLYWMHMALESATLILWLASFSLLIWETQTWDGTETAIYESLTPAEAAAFNSVPNEGPAILALRAAAGLSCVNWILFVGTLVVSARYIPSRTPPGTAVIQAVLFGFSVGVFLAAIDVATKIYTTLQPAYGASAKYQEAQENLRKIKYLLLCTTSILDEELMALYQFHTQRCTRPKLNDLAKLLRSTIDCFEKVYIVIDAIDERSEANNALLQSFLEEIERLSNANIFLTSRNLPLESPIEQRIARVDVAALDSDITKYLQSRMCSDRIQKLPHGNQATNDEIVNVIVSKANGMFLLASLQMDSLMSKKDLRKLKEAINTLPEKLHDAFIGIMERIKAQWSDGAEIALKILYWINYAPRPLTVDEIQHALAVRHGDRNLDPDGFLDEDMLVAVCCGLVTIRKESRTITLRHDSVREHFERHGVEYFPHPQADIQAAMLTYASFDVFAQGPCESEEEVGCVMGSG
ncbi:hypothetical protein G7Y89_g11992 [Cudoniella acicularis]|uniref:NACHT domain-containing protein n=1 Tax=Cudoniella acicularis TaxID=354080 RepID=A0A8H4RCE9_9HELO|nr:hypothetical protein G7Y89_g11992 [Cudoniella acicularis]